MSIKAFVVLSIAFANPVWAAEEVETGASGTWSFVLDQASPSDVGSEQQGAFGRFVYPASAIEAADVGGEQAVLISRSLTGHGLSADGTAFAQAAR